MTIKNQLTSLIFIVIVIPILGLGSFLFYNYLKSPERTLLNGYKQIRKMCDVQLDEDEWKHILEKIKQTPPDVETAILFGGKKVIASTMKEFKTGSEVDLYSVFETLRKTSYKYFYQIVSPTEKEDFSEILFISRVKRDKRDMSLRTNKLRYTLLFSFLIFELVFITLIANLSSTISKSIIVLEKNTERIANGELDLKLEPPKDNASNEITSLTQNLNKMRKALKDDQEQKTRFIMGISHDLRTPVAIIKGYTEALSDGVLKDPESKKNALSLITQKSDQLENMINTLINFVKLNTDEFRNNMKSQLIKPVLEEFCKNSTMTGTVFKRKVTTSISIDSELSIPFDKQLFERALENIFSNALRYSDDNDKILITAKQTESSITIKISDTGQGITDNDKNHIFDLFYKASSSRREEGMGIGLSVVKNIIDTHGWTITLNSKKDIGSTFSIIIPLSKEIKKTSIV